MANSDKIVKCGSKRNFDVAFLSGENEIDREEVKKKETDKAKVTEREKESTSLCKLYYNLIIYKT